MLSFLFVILVVLLTPIAWLAWTGIYLLTLRSAIAGQRDRYHEVVPCSPQDVPGLNPVLLDTATRELQGLGFEWLEDHTLRRVGESANATPWVAPIAAPSTPPPSEKFVPRSMARVMVHRGHGCLAKIMNVTVIKTADSTIANNSFSVAFVSSCEAGDKVWQYSTSNRAADATNDALMMLTRRPHYLSTRLPYASVPETLRVHLSRRADIARALGLTWKREPTAADDAASEMRSGENIRRVYSGLTPLSMAWKIFRNKQAPLSNRLEWLGELAGKLPPLAP